MIVFCSYEFFKTIYTTKLGGNGEVNHGDNNGSIVIKNIVHNEEGRKVGA